MTLVHMSGNIATPLQGNWGELADLIKAGDTNATGTTSVRMSDTKITVIVNDGSTTQSVSISIPDLGAMYVEPDQEALQSIADKILDVADSLAAAGAISADGTYGPELMASIVRLQATVVDVVNESKPSKFAPPWATGPSVNSMNTSKVLFDLFALMALMVEVAQKQRDTSREIRQAENLEIQNSIQRQAEEIRAAAAISLAFGIVSAVISGAMSATSMIMQARAFSQQTAATRQTNVPAQDLKTAQLATTPDAAKANLKTVETKMPEVRTRVLESKLDASDDLTFGESTELFKGKIQAADIEIKDAKAQQTQLGKELAQLKQDGASEDVIKAKQTECEQANERVSKATMARSELEHEFFGKLDLKVRSNDAKIATNEDRIAADKAALKSARGEEAAKLKAEIKKLTTENARLGQDNIYLRAVTADLKAQYASTDLKQVDLVKAQSRYDSAKQALQLDEKFTKSQQMMNRWMGIQQLSMTLSQVTNSTGSMISEMVRANSTMEGVEQTRHNEQLDQIKDLFQQALSVVQAVIQLMQAVLSAENDSLMEAIRA